MSPSSEEYRRARHLLALLTVSVVAVGCQRGDYTYTGEFMRNGGGVQEVLTIQTNGIYEIQIRYADGASLAATNRCKLRDGIMYFTDFYSTFDSMHGTTIEPPKQFTEFSLQTKAGLLIADYERGYYFRKKETLAVGSGQTNQHQP